jgi:tRNA dimethylallyltransferase
MIAEGLVDEVRMLLAEGPERMEPLAIGREAENDPCNPAALSLSTIGYREIEAFLRGKISLTESIVRAKRASRRLAKRQLTWFRADPEIIWLDAVHGGKQALKLFQDFFANRANLLPFTLSASTNS